MLILLILVVYLFIVSTGFIAVSEVVLPFGVVTDSVTTFGMIHEEEAYFVVSRCTLTKH